MKPAAEATGVLHLLLSADPGAWSECRGCCDERDSVVLYGEAVLALAQNPRDPLSGFPCSVAISAADADARGLPRGMAPPGVQFIDDAALVGLIASHRHCLSWR